MVNEVTGVTIGVREGGEEVAGETLEDEGRMEGIAEAWNERMEDTGQQDLTIETAPQSPTTSGMFSDAAHPPSSDTAIETTDIDDPMAGGDEGSEEYEPIRKWQRKRAKGSDDEGSEEHEPIRKWRKKVKGSDDESGGDHALSRSAEASRKLRESLKSGTFVVDEGKRERFEGKCRGLDGHAKFSYKGSWQVRHSKCSKWVTMREPYELVRFKDHVKGCKQMEEKGRNGTIDLFFKPRAKESRTTTTKMAQPSAQKQIVVGAKPAKLRETLIKPNRRLPSISFVSKERPCLGLGKDRDERINTYISRVIVEGAGSRSDAHVTKMLFSDGVKYSELDNNSKRYVTATQVHLQKWKISYTLGAVFSADCEGMVTVTDEAHSPTCNRCLDILKLDAFKKALSVQPPPLDNLKFTPHRHRNAATNLGMSLAKIEGLSNLLEKVSQSNFHDPI